jgi:hypothetical protein
MKPSLTVRWSRRERALLYDGHKPTGGLLAYYFEHVENYDKRTLSAELEARGYDLTTLRFSIRRKATP